jgi:hypothetical protein
MNVFDFSILMSFDSRAIGFSGDGIGVLVDGSRILTGWLNKLNDSLQT